MRFPSPLFRPLCLLFAFSAPLFAQDRSALTAPELSVPEFSFDLSSPILSFPFKIRDAEFSSSLNAIVAVSESPNQLHIYRPETGSLVSVNLQLPATCVSVSPDGRTAVTGHDAWISHVDLENAELLRTIPISAVVTDIVMGPNNFAYAFARGSFVPIYSVDLATLAESRSRSSIHSDTIARLHPGGRSIYGADTAVSPADIARYNIVDDLAQVSTDSPYHGDYPMCGNLWLSADGRRIYTACGRVFRASGDWEDMRYVGTFSKPVNIRWTQDTQVGSNVAVLPLLAATQDGEIQYFTSEFLLYRGSAKLPRFVTPSGSWAAQGRWLFFNAAGTKQYVVVQAETASKLAADFGLVTVDCSNASVVSDPGNASIGPAFTTGRFAITGSVGCGWASVSDSPWLNTNSTGVGDGVVTYTVTANGGPATRVGTITVGNATFTVSQSGVKPASLVATAAGPTQVSLSWTSAIAVDHFEVWRSSGGAFTRVATSASNTFTDTTTPNSGYVYKVRSVAADGAMSDFSAPDFAHTFAFVDPALAAGTRSKAAHVTDLRDAVNALRIAAGTTPASFSDGSLQSVAMKRVHLLEVREAIQGLRGALMMPAAYFGSVPEHDPIRAYRITELRAALE